MKPCHKEHPEYKEGCRLCYLAQYDARYQKLWDLPITGSTPPPPASSPRSVALPLCKHFDEKPVEPPGQRTGKNGQICNCVAQWLYGCDLHGSCVRSKEHARPGTACCEGCPDYATEDDSEQRRHLLYHIWPVKGEVWKRNLQQLKPRLKLFNGQKTIAIVTDHKAVSPQEVKDYLADPSITYIVRPNDPNLREVKTFEPLWSTVQSYQGPQDYTFYGHAKGVHRPFNPGTTVHWWTTVLYHTCLDYWPLVERLLFQYPTAGSFKKEGRGFTIKIKNREVPARSSWHYSGSFYWFRNRDVFSRNWKAIDREWWGIEAWPSIIFRPDEAATIFMKGKVPTLNLYEFSYWKEVVIPEYKKWVFSHAMPSLQRTS